MLPLAAVNASRLGGPVFLALVLFVAPAASAADLLEGRVVRIADGDTLSRASFIVHARGHRYCPLQVSVGSG